MEHEQIIIDFSSFFSLFLSATDGDTKGTLFDCFAVFTLMANSEEKQQKDNSSFPELSLAWRSGSFSHYNFLEFSSPLAVCSPFQLSCEIVGESCQNG